MRERRTRGLLVALIALLCLVVALVAPAEAAPLGPSAAPSAQEAKGDPAPGTDQLIVRLENDGPADQSTLSAAAGQPVEIVRRMDDGAWVIKLADTESEAEVESVATMLEARPDVTSVEPDIRLFPTAVPNDPDYATQWHYKVPTVAPASYGANLPPAWDITIGSTDVVTAVIDTGKRDHVDLTGVFLPGYDMIADSLIANDGGGRDANADDPGDWITSTESASGYFAGCQVHNSSWHGTHVAGTISANSNNGVGVAGISPGSKIVPVRALGKCGGYSSDIADGIRWAAGLAVSGTPLNANPADVINLSLGGQAACEVVSQNAINAAVAAGSVVVVSAGNSNLNVSGFTPASCNNVITVAATSQPGNRSYYSNFGALVEIAAPGGDYMVDSTIRSTLNAGTTVPGADSYANFQGTSMSAPHVTGVVALMRDVNPDLTPAEITTMLQANVTPFPGASTCSVALCGTGILNAGAAVAAAQAAAVLPVPSAPPAPTLSAGGAAALSVAFSPPSFDGLSPITGYTVTCTSVDGGAPGTASGPASPVVVGSLTMGKTYTCTVFATNINGDGDPSPASAALVVPVTGSLSGVVRSDAGFAIKGVKVTLYDGTVARETIATGLNGEWSIPLVPAGSNYRLRIRDPRGDYLTEYHLNQATLGTSTPVTVTGAANTVVNTALTPASATASVTGTVTNANGGAPISGIQVTFYRYNVSVRTVTTNASGAYSLAGLDTAATWQVRFRSVTNTYVTEYWNDQTTFGRATPLTLTGGGTATANAALQAVADLAQLSGTVTEQGSGTPLSGVQVRLYSGATVVGTVITSASGGFNITIATPGTYTVRFHDPAGGHILEWHNNSPSQAGATPVVLGLGTSVVTNAALVLPV